MTTIAVLGTLDTKGPEHAYLAQLLRDRGCRVLLIDVGTGAPATVVPDVSRAQLLGIESQGAHDVFADLNRGASIARMIEAAPAYVRKLVDAGAIDGIISLGGSGGTAIGTAVMRGLPLGFPKVMVSTMASGNVAQYIDVSDLVMVPSLVDISGLNRLSRGVLNRAAGIVMGWAASQSARGSEHSATQPLILASMFGNTTPCVTRAQSRFEAAQFEVLVFHATGTGGRTMEAIIAAEHVAGVFDVTTTEWADECVGGVMPGGPHRLLAAALRGTPAVVAPGCLDMVNFGPPDTVPARFAGRTLYPHNPQVTLMRTSVDECRQMGTLIAERLNRSIGPVAVVFPRQGLSLLGRPGEPFHDPPADDALLESLQRTLRRDIPLIALDCDINHPRFADTAADLLLAMIHQQGQSPPLE